MKRGSSAIVAVLTVLTGLVLGADARADLVPIFGVVNAKDHRCGRSDLPETGLQGDVPVADQMSSRAEEGYNCGLALVGHATLDVGGRSPNSNANMAWVDDCAYVTGPGAVFGEPNVEPGDGVAVVDASDPRRPRHVRTLRTPGAIAALETIHAVETSKRSILVVGQYGNQAGPNKPMDIYDVTNCAKPKLLQTFVWPANIHNLTITPNGRYVFATQPLQAVDLAPLFDGKPKTGVKYLGNIEEVTPGPPFAVGPIADIDDVLPAALRAMTNNFYLSHEAWPTFDGSTLYVGGQLPIFETFSILDLRAWLKRDASGAPSGPPRVVSQRSGRGHSVRTATIGNRRFAVHSEESVLGPTYGCLPESANPFLGPAEPWLTDVTDPRSPRLVAQFGLEINEPQNCAAAVASNLRTSVHYHDVDDPKDTTFVMASMWNAGIRVFDVRRPERPVEVAYFNPGDINTDPSRTRLDHAWGHIRWVPETGHMWFVTASGGFWIVELEPQVRRQLGLDTGPVPSVLHPTGRPARRGVRIRADAPIVDALADGGPMSCAVPYAGSRSISG